VERQVVLVAQELLGAVGQVAVQVLREHLLLL
jgi:hypothetical protein